MLVVARMAYQRGSHAWRTLHPHEREQLRDLVAKSKGRPSNLTELERRRLRELAAKALHAAREG